MKTQLCCRCELRALQPDDEICAQCAVEIYRGIAGEVISAYRWLNAGVDQRVARPPRLTANPQILMWLKGLINGR